MIITPFTLEVLSYMPSWKAKDPGEAYASNPGLGASK
jgi:hypothetical protein